MLKRILILVTVLITCFTSTYSKSLDEFAYVDSTYEYYDTIDSFFNNFQQTNSDWTNTVEGPIKLRNAFEQKITSDIDFAKILSGTSNNPSTEIPTFQQIVFGQVFDANNDVYAFKCFTYKIYIKLIKPLSDGTTTVSATYTIVNLIPYSIFPEAMFCKYPYIENANYCNVFYFRKKIPETTLDLGIYIIGNNSNKKILKL